MYNRSNSFHIKLPVVSVLLAYFIWGIQPLYWQFFKHIPLTHILAHRIVWSMFLLVPMTLLTNRWEKLCQLFKSLKKLLLVALCAFMIGANWLIYIYATSSKQVVEASLGHYITPILIIFLGVIVLKEKIQIYKIIAICVAILGVVNLTLNIGKIPFIALLLIFTFTVYTFLKKVVDIDPIVGITAETLLLSPFMIIFLIFRQSTGIPIFADETVKSAALLISTGLFTSMPLLLYAFGVRAMNLSNLGFIQYVAPTIGLIIGIFVFKEPFTRTHLISFGLIWIAIAIVILLPLFSNSKKSMMKRTEY